LLLPEAGVETGVSVASYASWCNCSFWFQHIIIELRAVPILPTHPAPAFLQFTNDPHPLFELEVGNGQLIGQIIEKIAKGNAETVVNHPIIHEVV
jgi:hypothetical protein